LYRKTYGGTKNQFRAANYQARPCILFVVLPIKAIVIKKLPPEATEHNILINKLLIGTVLTRGQVVNI